MCWFELLKALSHLFKVTRPTFIDFGGGIGRLINVSELAPPMCHIDFCGRLLL
jgi:hypothetical protein